MIVVDTGPLVALFDPADGDHKRCAQILGDIDEMLCTTVPVMTEAFHLLGPGSIASQRLMDFVVGQGLNVWFMDHRALRRAFELMVQYADQPMDLADASLVVLAETLKLRRIFTIDRDGFSIFQIQRGHQQLSFEMLC